MVWAIRTARPDLQLNVHAIDISQESWTSPQRRLFAQRFDAMASENEEAAKQKGDVSWNTRETECSMFERVSPRNRSNVRDEREPGDH